MGAGAIDLGQVALAEPDVLRRHLEQLVIGEEVEALLERHLGGGCEPDHDVGVGGAHVGLLLLLADVDRHIARPLLDAHDHPLVDLLARLDEGEATLLRVGESEGENVSRAGRHHRAVALLPEVARPGTVAEEQRAHDPGAAGDRQEGVPEADQATGRDCVVEPDAGLCIGDLDHLAAAPAEGLADRAQVLLGDVDGEVLEWFHKLAVDLLGDDLGTGDLELVALPPHGLDQHREVELAAAADQEAIG